jgi:hypothetical protein
MISSPGTADDEFFDESKELDASIVTEKQAQIKQLFEKCQASVRTFEKLDLANRNFLDTLNASNQPGKMDEEEPAPSKDGKAPPSHELFVGSATVLGECNRITCLNMNKMFLQRRALSWRASITNSNQKFRLPWRANQYAATGEGICLPGERR